MAGAGAAAKLHLVRPCLFHHASGSQLLPPLLSFKPSFIFQHLTSLAKTKLPSSYCDAVSWRRRCSRSGGLVAFRRSFSTTPPAHVSDSGSIDSPLMRSMENKIREHLHAEFVTVKDAYGDGRHVCIDVVSSAFEGESAVNRQRMVYKAIWEELQSTVHAVDQMSTRTPTEAAAAADK